MEALRRARYKFPGRQKIIVSKKWGFTSLDRADYEALRNEHKVMPDGAYVQVSPEPSLVAVRRQGEARQRLTEPLLTFPLPTLNTY
jgi:hypothetical protein